MTDTNESTDSAPLEDAGSDHTNPYAVPETGTEELAKSASRRRRGRRVQLQHSPRMLRLIGSLIDGMLYLMCLIPAFFDMESLDEIAEMTDPFAIYGEIFQSPITLALLAIYMSVMAFLVATRSQSIGKFFLGMQIVSKSGRRAGFGVVFLARNVIPGLLGIIPLFALIDPLFIFTKDYQCLHDKIAKTFVVEYSPDN